MQRTQYLHPDTQFSGPGRDRFCLRASETAAFYEIPSTLCYDGRIDKLSASKMLEVFQIQMLSYESLLPDMQKDDYIICVDSQKHSGNVTDFVGG